jgi:hypothetical protein
VALVASWKSQKLLVLRRLLYHQYMDAVARTGVAFRPEPETWWMLYRASWFFYNRHIALRDLRAGRGPEAWGGRALRLRATRGVAATP